MFSDHPKIDLGLVLKQLASVRDEELRREITNYNLAISDEKFHAVFSAYGLTRLLSGLDEKCLRGNVEDIPSQELEQIRRSGVLIFRAYVAFVMMRSDTLERRLDEVPVTSPLRPFRDFFRSGRRSQSDDTMAQHIRNAICHGTFSLRDLSTVRFQDRDWVAEISAKDFFDGLCEQVFRFYECAFYASRPTA
ncbi:MAG TPA: hypothetical protein VNK48_07195 [Xanthobacteraceae bacterium]|nr:hypothetical protein [Xanthobacteraceae bacterium]